MSKRHTDRNAAMVALHQKGLSYAKIANLFPPISRQRVGQIVKEASERLSPRKR